MVGQPLTDPEERSAPRTTWSLGTQLRVLGGLVALCWAVVVIDLFLPWERSLLNYGVRPRDVDSLVNILFVPFLHIGFSHVAANTFGFLTLGWLVLVRSSRHFLLVSIVSAILSGLGCWLFSWPGTVTVGASGVIYGYLGFLLAWGFLDRSLMSIAITVVIAIIFGGVLWGVLPREAGISWQGHLFGLIGGGLAAWLLASRPAGNGAAALPVGSAARKEDNTGVGVRT